MKAFFQLDVILGAVDEDSVSLILLESTEKAEESRRRAAS